jgi:hypothetical protein
MTLEELRPLVEREIDHWEKENAKISGRADRDFQLMRESVVEPYWASVVIKDFSSAPFPVRECAVVIDDGTYNRVVYDPIAEHFSLVVYGDAGMETIGVNGDAVGCFLAR